MLGAEDINVSQNKDRPCPQGIQGRQIIKRPHQYKTDLLKGAQGEVSGTRRTHYIEGVQLRGYNRGKESVPEEITLELKFIGCRYQISKGPVMRLSRVNIGTE